MYEIFARRPTSPPLPLPPLHFLQTPNFACQAVYVRSRCKYVIKIKCPVALNVRCDLNKIIERRGRVSTSSCAISATEHLLRIDGNPKARPRDTSFCDGNSNYIAPAVHFVPALGLLSLSHPFLASLTGNVITSALARSVATSGQNFRGKCAAL